MSDQHPSAEGGAGVYVTQKAIYELLQQTKAAVDKLVTQRSNDVERIDDHEDRLRAVERRILAIPSAGIVIAVIAVVVSFVRP